MKQFTQDNILSYLNESRFIRFNYASQLCNILSKQALKSITSKSIFATIKNIILTNRLSFIVYYIIQRYVINNFFILQNVIVNVKKETQTHLPTKYTTYLTYNITYNVIFARKNSLIPPFQPLIPIHVLTAYLANTSSRTILRK